MTVSTMSPLQSPTIVRIVEAEGLAIRAVGNERDGRYFEINMPLAVHNVETEYRSQVSAAWDDSLTGWQVYVDTANDGTIDASHAHDFGTQVVRAAELAQRLNKAAK